ncbi:MAG TPA: alpha/beta fold hydrolase [Acidimicrobiales bacterium]|nr:alpha/beta fold hydrolase [Acidimicrobiales bacterium]
MTSPSTTPARLHFIADAPVKGLAVAERRVQDPRACVIFVHGALDRGGSFARLVRRLDSFDAVTYDRRGYQGSRDLGPADFDVHVDDLSTLVAREAGRQPVILFGHSFGGLVTFAAVVRIPSKVQLVVNFESPLPWILRRASSRPPLTDDARHEAERFFRRVVSPKAWDRLSEHQRESRRLDGPALLRDLATVQRSEEPFDIAALHVPATYAHGDGVLADYYRALSVELSRVNPSIETLEIDHANHDAHLKNAEQLAAVVRQRWDQVCASG